VHRLDELEFFLQSLTPVLGVDVLQRLVVQVLEASTPQRMRPSISHAPIVLSEVTLSLSTKLLTDIVYFTTRDTSCELFDFE